MYRSVCPACNYRSGLNELPGSHHHAHSALPIPILGPLPVLARTPAPTPAQPRLVVPCGPEFPADLSPPPQRHGHQPSPSQASFFSRNSNNEGTTPLPEDPPGCKAFRQHNATFTETECTNGWSANHVFRHSVRDIGCVGGRAACLLSISVGMTGQVLPYACFSHDQWIVVP